MFPAHVNLERIGIIITDIDNDSNIMAKWSPGAVGCFMFGADTQVGSRPDCECGDIELHHLTPDTRRILESTPILGMERGLHQQSLVTFHSPNESVEVVVSHNLHVSALSFWAMKQ